MKLYYIYNTKISVFSFLYFEKVKYYSAHFFIIIQMYLFLNTNKWFLQYQENLVHFVTTSFHVFECASCLIFQSLFLSLSCQVLDPLRPIVQIY